MSWLQDVKTKKQRALEDREVSGFFCGYCSNRFSGDLQQLHDHQNAGKQMCKGVDDKFDKELYLKRKEEGLET